MRVRVPPPVLKSLIRSRVRYPASDSAVPSLQPRPASRPASRPALRFRCVPGVPKTCRLVSNPAVFEGDVPDFCRLGTLHPLRPASCPAFPTLQPFAASPPSASAVSVPRSGSYQHLPVAATELLSLCFTKPLGSQTNIPPSPSDSGQSKSISKNR